MKIHVVVFSAVALLVPLQLRSAELDAVFADWEKLRAGMSRVKYVAEGETIDTKGMYNDSLAILSQEEKAQAPNGDLPPEDHRFRRRAAYLLDFDRKLARKEITWEIFFLNAFRHIPKYRVWLFDGKEMQEYEPRDQNTFPGFTLGQYEPELLLMDASFGDAFFDAEDLAPFLASGIVPTLDGITAQQMRPPLDRSAFRLTGTAELEGRRQLVLRTSASPSNPGKYAEVWVDPSRGNTVSQWTRFGNLRHRYDLRYAETPNGWVLASWKWLSWDQDRLTRWSTMAVTARDFNPDLDATEFHVQPRPGMVIREPRRPLYVKGAPGQPDRDVRELLNAPSSWRLSSFGVVAAAIAGVIVLVAAVVTRRRRKLRRP